MQRHAARQARSSVLVSELRTWFEVQAAKLPAPGQTAEAIRYAFNHWDGLVQFLDDGCIEIDSNSVERSMRPGALSRKSALFAGNDEGGQLPLRTRAPSPLMARCTNGATRSKPFSPSAPHA